MRQKDLIQAIEACKRLADEQRARSTEPMRAEHYRASFLNYLTGYLSRDNPAVSAALKAVIDASYES